MGGGGTAPKMKMSDALILTGITLLLGGLFMHAWVSPIAHGEDDQPYTNGASMMSGDSFNIEVTVESEALLRIVLKDEGGDIISAKDTALAADETHREVIEVETSGFYSYEINTRNTSATISVDIDRKLMLDMLPFPLGALFLSLGIYQRSISTKDNEVLDAELDV